MIPERTTPTRLTQLVAHTLVVCTSLGVLVVLAVESGASWALMVVRTMNSAQVHPPLWLSGSGSGSGSLGLGLGLGLGLALGLALWVWLSGCLGLLCFVLCVPPLLSLP